MGSPQKLAEGWFSEALIKRVDAYLTLIQTYLELNIFVLKNWVKNLTLNLVLWFIIGHKNSPTKKWKYV